MIDTNKDFPATRYKHCHAVGKKMQEYAKNVLKWDKYKCNAMYLLGMFHDLGYELNGDCFEHDSALCDTLKKVFNLNVEDDFLGAIKYHSELKQDGVISPILKLLYFADQTVDGYGNYCTYEDRLKDIEKRHGKDSRVYKATYDLIEACKEWGFDDNVERIDPSFVIPKENYKEENRFKHCHNVGKRMQEYAKNILNWEEDKCNAMLILGMFHDIGYELNGDCFEHDKAMCDTLCCIFDIDESNPFISAIKDHSYLIDGEISPCLQLLYFADQTVDGTGNWCTYEERLDDIKRRHGENSRVYKETKTLVDAMKKCKMQDEVTIDRYNSCLKTPPKCVAISDNQKTSINRPLEIEKVTHKSNQNINRI